MAPTDTEYYIDGIALTAVSIFGITGTLMSMRVLLRPQLRNSFSTLLLGLAGADANFLFFAMLVIGLPKSWEWYHVNASAYIIPLAYGFMGVARTSSVYLTMAVTLERYYAIVKPFTFIGWIKRKLLLFSILFATFYNIPKFFEYKRDIFVWTNETIIVATDLRHSELYISIYLTWMKLIFIEGIPYLTILTLNIAIIKKIIKSSEFRETFRPTRSASQRQAKPHWTSPSSGTKALSKTHSIHRQILRIGSKLKLKNKDQEAQLEQHQQSGTMEMDTINNTSSAEELPDVVQVQAPETEPGSNDVEAGLLHQQPAQMENSNGNQQEISLGLTLVFISLLFIVCQSVKIIPDIYEMVCTKVEDMCPSSPLIDTIISFANLLTCINSAVNYLVYMLRGKKFRDAFLTTYKCQKFCCPWLKEVQSPGRLPSQSARSQLSRVTVQSPQSSMPQLPRQTTV